jgi:ribosomal protein S18 acetylase RimI-like enzyme
MTLKALTIRDGRPEDAPLCAAIYNAWVDETPWMPRVHPPEDVERHFLEHVFEICKVVVAETDGRVCGVLAVDGEGYVAVLSVASHVRERGVGARLIDEAKSLRPEGLMAWTFVANEGAQRFYLRHGFDEIARTDGDNEEGLADILYGWGRAV